MIPYLNRHKRDIVLVTVFVLLSLVVFMIPTGFDNRVDSSAVNCRGRVVGVENSGLQQFGIVKSGDQTVQLELLSGPFKGRKVEGNNPLMGQMDRDKVFKIGDEVLVVLTLDEKGNILFVNPQDYYRLGLELILLVLFALVLLLFGGWTGAKALLSFIFSGLMLWRILIPGMLRGYDPILLSLGVVAVLTAVIIFLVAGLTRKGVTAFLGAFLGVLCSCILAIYFTREFHVHGAVMPFAETLLYSGYAHLDLAKIYIAAVFLAASGAVMDLAMDIAASMDEVVHRREDLTPWEGIKSGLRVGRTVVGTMTTTLLFAYSGGYLTLLMAFMAQGVPLANLFNLIYVATEILKTLVGSFGLVMVAPFTALVGGFVLIKKRNRGVEQATALELS